MVEFKCRTPLITFGSPFVTRSKPGSPAPRSYARGLARLPPPQLKKMSGPLGEPIDTWSFCLYASLTYEESWSLAFPSFW